MKKSSPKRLNQRQINYLFNKICKLLKKKGQINIIIKRMKKNRGLTDEKNIWLDPDDRILPTLIHECLHILYPDKDEKEITTLEKKVAKRITDNQMKKLLILLIEVLKYSKQSISLKTAIKEPTPQS